MPEAEIIAQPLVRSTFAVLASGFLLSFGLLFAVGPQNVYVLRKGLSGHHVLVVAGTCFLADASLIVLGAAGVGALVATSPTLAAVAGWGGVAVLLGYAGWSFHAATRPDVISPEDIEQVGAGARGRGAGAAVVMALALSYLNPHVYFDTLVLIGPVAAQFEGAGRWAFTLGAVMASAVWFFGIGYGARLLAPWFRTSRAWRLLDIVSGLIMLAVAATLLFGLLGAGH